MQLPYMDAGVQFGKDGLGNLSCLPKIPMGGSSQADKCQNWLTIVSVPVRLETANFQQGDLYVVRYRAVRELLIDKWIAMI